jgi:hypothetical protein
METQYKYVISIHGVPRSGTSWLGQIFNSHPNVAYRFQPLFSYHFKDRITSTSSTIDIIHFLNELYEVNDDEFILGNWKKNVEPKSPYIKKEQFPAFMVMKMVRYHHLIEKFVRASENIKIIGIVRNPCAVINSWLQAPKEFQKGWNPMAEWRYAPSKNQGRIEEYNGFEKWKELALCFLELERKYPNRFYLIQYEQLVVRPAKIMEEVFSFVGLEMEQQVTDFIRASQGTHLEDAYAVYKTPNVKDKWRTQLDSRIVTEIASDLRGTILERFLQ